MNKRISLGIAGLGLIAALLACYGERPVSTSPAAISTIVAATMRAITPPASTSTLPAPSPVPTLPVPAPTSAAAAATRINFLSGATTGVVSGPIAAGQTLSYVLQAGQGQPMLVQVDSPRKDVSLSIQTQGGTSLLSPDARRSSWQGTLPQTEDYVVTLYGGVSTEQFTLTVEIVSRIKFAQGADSAKISGGTPGGYGVAYTIFAVKDQKMVVALYGVGRNATLTVWGYANGKTYQRAASNKTSFAFTVPTTQDYIFEIVPKAGQVLDFVIYVRIQ